MSPSDLKINITLELKLTKHSIMSKRMRISEVTLIVNQPRRE